MTAPLTEKELAEIERTCNREDIPLLIENLRAARALLRDWLNEHREGNCEASMFERVAAALPPEDK